MDNDSVAGVGGGTARRMLVMGVGGSGVGAVASMCRMVPSLDAVVVDTDEKVLETMSPEQVIHLGGPTTRNFSAGGDMELGRQSVEKNSSNIRKQLHDIDLLVVVTGLGGGTGSGAVPVITRLAHETGTLVLCLASMPFAFEGKKVHSAAEEALKRIRTHADAIVRFSNERLINRADGDLPVEKAFARSHQVMCDAVFAIWRMLSSKGVCGLDFASIHTMLRNCDGFCHFASAKGSGVRRAGVVANRLLKHHLLNNGKLFASASGIIVGLTGGPDLKLSEVETVMQSLQSVLDGEVWFNYGVTLDPEFKGKLSVVVLLAEQWREPLVDSANRQMGLPFGGRGVKQGELPLEPSGKGRFENLDPTVLNNQDLDVPTYIRRDIKLPR